MGNVAGNLRIIQEQMEHAARRAGRDPSEITLVAATKDVPPELIEEAIAAGVEIIGENRVQEALKKHKVIGDSVHWHMIGHLQRNKVEKALEIFELIQSVDSYRLADEVNKRAQRTGKAIDVLIEVNTSGEETKFGVRPEDLIGFLQSVTRMQGLNVRGLMTIGVFSPHPGIIRPSFARLRELKEEIERKGIGEIEFLSMGMTSDFEIAIEEGSNMVRIGTGIFGARRR